MPPENKTRGFDVFKGCRNWILSWNGLNHIQPLSYNKMLFIKLVFLLFIWDCRVHQGPLKIFIWFINLLVNRLISGVHLKVVLTWTNLQVKATGLSMHDLLGDT